MRVVLLVAAVVALAGALGTVVMHTYDQFAWRSYYSAARLFGDHCEITSGEWPGTFQAAATAAGSAADWRAHQMPYRGTPNVPRTPPGRFLATRCGVDLSDVDATEASLSMSFVFGESALFINDELRALTRGGYELETPLAPKDVGRTSSLLLISRGNDEGAVGMGSLVPPYIATEASQVRVIKHFLQSVLGEQRIFRIGVASLMALLFAALWLSGLRYWDIVWIVAIGASVTLDNAMNYLSSQTLDRYWIYRTSGLANWTFAVATLLLQFSRLRADSFPRWLKLLAATLAALGAASIYAVSDAQFLSYRMMTQAQSYVLAFGLVVYLPVAAWRLRAQTLAAPARRRIKQSMYLAAFAAFIFIVQAIIEDAQAVFLEPLAQAILLYQYAIAVLIDLARRQFEYFAERKLRLKTEEDAALANAVARSAQMLAHDVRRPFQMIDIYLKKMAAVDSDETIKAAMVADLYGAKAEVESLLEDLQSFDAAALRCVEAVDLGKIVAEVWGGLALDATAKGVRLELNLAASNLSGDRQKIRRILRNILENAVQAADDGGTVTVASQAKPGQRAEVTIRNTGSFVDAEIRGRLFDVAFTMGKVGGTGLGLAIVKRFVEAHGGEVRCESHRAEGTAFVFTLPMHVGVAPAHDRVDSRKRASETDLIVLVDDDKMIRMSWDFLMRGKNFVAYASPGEALAGLQQAPLAVIVDRNFHGDDKDGLWLASQIKAKFPAAVVLLSSSDVTAPAGAQDFIDGRIDKEPLGFDELLEKIRASGRMPLQLSA